MGVNRRLRYGHEHPKMEYGVTYTHVLNLAEDDPAIEVLGGRHIFVMHQPGKTAGIDHTSHVFGVTSEFFNSSMVHPRLITNPTEIEEIEEKFKLTLGSRYVQRENPLASVATPNAFYRPTSSGRYVIVSYKLEGVITNVVSSEIPSFVKNFVKQEVNAQIL